MTTVLTVNFCPQSKPLTNAEDTNDAVNGSAHRRSEKDKDLEEELENPMGSVGL